jgi:DNA replication ATP-dependent helicase Dna2
MDQPEAFLTDPRIRDFDPTVSSRLCISSVQDIEEDIWSPRLGLKGKVDASIQASLIGPPTPFWPLGKQDESVLPFEIKTGRSTSVLQHRAQTMLYTQMMSDRYGAFLDYVC